MYFNFVCAVFTDSYVDRSRLMSSQCLSVYMVFKPEIGGKFETNEVIERSYRFYTKKYTKRYT